VAQYPQYDLIEQYHKDAGVAWSVCMPGPIIGAAIDAAMNLPLGLAMYAAVSAHLKQPLVYPGHADHFGMIWTMSSSMMNAYMEEWVVLQGPPNEIFNAQDGGIFTWEQTWPEVAKYFGIEAQGPKDSDPYPHEYVPPMNPRGFGPLGKTRVQIDLFEWAKREEVRQAWREICEKQGLRSADAIEDDRIWGITSVALCRYYPGVARFVAHWSAVRCHR
jgi:hypothetical protein